MYFFTANDREDTEIDREAAEDAFEAGEADIVIAAEAEVATAAEDVSDVALAAAVTLPTEASAAAAESATTAAADPVPAAEVEPNTEAGEGGDNEEGVLNGLNAAPDTDTVLTYHQKLRKARQIVKDLEGSEVMCFGIYSILTFFNVTACFSFSGFSSREKV